MKILIACERSGIVREAFAALGHDAWSCDWYDSEIPGRHIKGDVLNVMEDYWDMMIAHPPCRFLAVSGAWKFKERPLEIEAALDFVRALMNAPIPYIVIENPVSLISTHIRKPDQIIQPYQFGEDASKRTCLWLKGLPKLQPTKYVPPSRIVNGKGRWANQTPSGQNKLGPSDERPMNRARTYPGIASAMASQWTGFFHQAKEGR